MPNFALISTAHSHTPAYVDTIRNRDGCDLVAIWDDIEDRGRRFANRAECEFFSHLDDVISRDDVDGFLICSSNTQHLPLLQATIPMGKPIFCEKPFTTTVADAIAALELIAQHHTVTLMGYFMPFWAEMQEIATLIASDYFGKITHAWMRNSHAAAYRRLFDDSDLVWFTDPAQSGGGAFMDLGTHAVHLVRTLFGPVDRVCAQIDNVSGIYPSVDDYGTAQFEMRSGIHVTVEASWVQTGGHSGLELTGSDSTLFNHPDQGYVVKKGDDFQALSQAVARPTRIERLAGAIEGSVTSEELQADLACAADAVAIVAACYRSNEEKKWIDVEKIV